MKKIFILFIVLIQNFYLYSSSFVNGELEEGDKSQNKTQLKKIEPIYKSGNYLWQSCILRKISLFYKENKNIYSEEMFHYFSDSQGECHGLSILWGLGHLISDKLNPEGNPRDDIDYFNNTIKKLILWDGEMKHLHPEDKQDFERFISLLVLAQGQAPSYRIDHVTNILNIDHDGFEALSNFEIIDKKEILKPKKVFPPLTSEFNTNKYYTSEVIFAQQISKILLPKTFILVVAPTGNVYHVIGIYKNSINKIFLYDPNSRLGEKEIDSYENLAKDVFQIFSSEWIKFPIQKFELCAYTLDNLESDYPNTKDLIPNNVKIFKSFIESFPLIEHDLMQLFCDDEAKEFMFKNNRSSYNRINSFCNFAHHLLSENLSHSLNATILKKYVEIFYGYKIRLILEYKPNLKEIDKELDLANRECNLIQKRYPKYSNLLNEVWLKPLVDYKKNIEK